MQIHIFDICMECGFMLFNIFVFLDVDIFQH